MSDLSILALGGVEQFLDSGADRRNLSFMTRLELAVRYADNASARECMRDLGFQYLNGALHDGGFYDENGKGGLWLSKRYGVDGTWKGARRSPIGGTMQGATARSVASMLTLIAQDRIMQPGIALEMRTFMHDEDIKPDNWLIEGLNAADDPLPPGFPPLPAGDSLPMRWITEYVGKIGDIDDLSCDCALISRYSHGKLLRYVSVVLNASSPSVIREVSVKLDDCIRERHLPPPPSQPAPPP